MSVLHTNLLGEIVPVCAEWRVHRQQLNVTWFKGCLSSSSPKLNFSYTQYKRNDALRYQCSAASSKDSVACKDILHASREKGRSPLCVLKCTFNTDCNMKDLSQTSHENGRSLLWMRTWLFRILRCLKDILHTSHEKGRSPLCNRKCIFTVDCHLKDFLHTSQDKGCSLL